MSQPAHTWITELETFKLLLELWNFGYFLIKMRLHLSKEKAHIQSNFRQFLNVFDYVENQK